MFQDRDNSCETIFSHLQQLLATNKTETFLDKYGNIIFTFRHIQVIKLQFMLESVIVIYDECNLSFSDNVSQIKRLSSSIELWWERLMIIKGSSMKWTNLVNSYSIDFRGAKTSPHVIIKSGNSHSQKWGNGC